MRRLLIAAATGALLIPGISQAADWTGFYLGAQLGYGDLSSAAPGVGGTGGFIGFTGGYDLDFGDFVVGAAVDADFTDITVDLGSDLQNVLRLKFRLGYDVGPALVYLTAGGARARADQFGWDNGYFGGIGFDYLLDPNFSVGVELLSHQFNNFDGTGIDVDLGTAAVRAVFRF